MSLEENPKRLVTIRPRAVADIERHALYLEENATEKIAQRFRNSIMNAVERISAMPEAGAPRKVRNPLLSGLRMWIVPEFRNYLIFYITPEDSVEILRVFHGAQDVNNMLEDEE